MTDSPYPSEWDDAPPPHPLDPRLGTVIDAIRPTRAERALVADLVQKYVSRDHEFGATFQHFWLDRINDGRWHAVFMALLEQFAATAVGAQGEALSIARAEEDASHARTDVAKFGL